MISRRGFLQAGAASLAATSLSGPALAEAPTRSIRPPRRPERGGPAPDRLIEAAGLGGAVGFLLMEAATGRVLEARGADIAVPPASVAKVVTALYALDRLGPSHRFRTRILATGPVEAGVVQGDLVLAGAGDPTLQTDQMGDLAASLARAGIKGASGRFLVWDGALPGARLIAADQPVQVGYNPALGGLNLNFNRVHFEWKRQGDGWGVAMDARGERFLPPVRMARVRVVNRDLPVYTYSAQGSEEDWTVAATALGKGGSRWLPVRLPAVYAAEVFQTLARAQGIRLPEPEFAASLPPGTEVAAVESGPLSEMLRDMLRYSTNITAECVGLLASGASGIAASGQEMTGWAARRYGLRARFVDHSGLGGESRVSAAAIAGLLHAARDSGLRDLLRDVGMRDEAGKVIKGHPVRVLAKSGTLNFVSGLAGHIVPAHGRELIFAIFAADASRRAALTEAERESPPGGADWTRRARGLQARLISRWALRFA